MIIFYKNIMSTTTRSIFHSKKVDNVVGIVFIGIIPWHASESLYKPYTIFFPFYNKKEITDILCLDFHQTTILPIDLYIHFIDIILGVFSKVTFDLIEIRHLVDSLWPKYNFDILN